MISLDDKRASILNILALIQTWFFPRSTIFIGLTGFLLYLTSQEIDKNTFHLTTIADKTKNKIIVIMTRLSSKEFKLI